MKVKLEHVFTPASSASLTYVKRPYLDKQLMKSLKIQGMQLIMYGQTGSGKTTYLKNILGELERDYISVSCTQTTTVESMISDTIDRMKITYLSESKTQVKSKKRGRFGVGGYGYAEGQNERAEGNISRPIQKPQINESKLAQILGKKKLIWVIEDFHKVQESEKLKFAQMLKLFVNEADVYPSLHVIAIGAVNSAREVLEYDIELSNRIEELYVPLLNTEEIESIVDIGTEILNVGFSNEIRTAIVHFSNRIAAICHQLCFNLCLNANVEDLQKKSIWDKLFGSPKMRIILSLDVFKAALVDYIMSNSDTFHKVIDRLNNHENGSGIAAKEIIKNFLVNRRDWMTKKEIVEELKSKYTKEVISATLEKLCSSELGEVFRYNSDSEQYIFSDSVFRAYLLIQHESGHSGDFYSHSNSNRQFIDQMIEKSDTFRKLKQISEGENNNY